MAPGNTDADFTKDGTDAVLPNTLGFIVSNNDITSFSPFTFATKLAFASQPLPVEGMVLSAKYSPELEAVEISWNTFSEYNNDYFVIERYNENIQDYERIGKNPGAGNSDRRLSYHFNDSQVANGETYYYRIKQVDLDGEYVYSNIDEATVNSLKEKPIKIFPNPTGSGNIHVALESGEKIDLQITIYDMVGNLVYIKNYKSVSGTFQINTDKSLARGVYMVNLRSSGTVVSDKLIIE